jgi:hypothetical protein
LAAPAGALPLLLSVLSRSRSSSPSLTTYFLTAGCFAVTAHLRVYRKDRFRDWPQNQRREALVIVSHSDFRTIEHARLDEETGIWKRI